VKVERADGGVRIELDAGETYLLRRALEKASFIDIPREDQPGLAVFCTKALEALAQATT
jgi:hypothetical protein